MRGFVGAAGAALLVSVPHAMAANREILFTQPSLPGIAGHFFIRKKPDRGRFWLTQWQTNPYTGKDEPVPSSWPASRLTGFDPGQPLREHQAGNRDQEGSSTAQIKGDVVAVYVNSRDYDKAACQPRCKANLMAGYSFAQPQSTFEDPKARIEASITAKVPTATKSGQAMSFVNVRLRLQDRKSKRMVSFGINLFSLGSRRDFDVVGQDPHTGDVMLNSRFLPGMKFVSLAEGSARAQSEPFADFKTFRASISADNFREALREAKADGYGNDLSDDPAQYQIVHIHIEPELTRTSAGSPASLGAAFKGFEIARVR